jgi:hypothetical protein
MGWTFDSTKVSLPVVKKNGECRNAGMQKYCPYWVAKNSREFGDNKKILGFRCTLFNEDKVGYASLPACNTEYGLTYDGPPHV